MTSREGDLIICLLDKREKRIFCNYQRLFLFSGVVTMANGSALENSFPHILTWVDEHRQHRPNKSKD
jgi:hypothetical protein